MSKTFVTSVASARRKQRDVLAAGVHDDLDRRVGEQRRQRRDVEALGERVEQLDRSPPPSGTATASWIRHSSVR